jgi:hypothetical protein
VLASSSPPSLVGMIAHSLYGAVSSLTGMVGLTPLQGLYVVAGLLAALLSVQFYMAATERRSWSLDDERGTDA